MDSIFHRKKDQSFSLKGIFEGHQLVTYRGVKTIKCPFDYVIYQMLLWEMQPDLVIEIGTNRGGTALYMADLLDRTGHGMVHTIDISDQADRLVKDHPRIKLFFEGFQGYDPLNAQGFETVVVIEDGSHLYEDTLAILEKFSPLVTPGSYMVVEDGIIKQLGLANEYQGGPTRAIHQFLEQHPEFKIDRKWCDMFGVNATFNVDGYLKKKNVEHFIINSNDPETG